MGEIIAIIVLSVIILYQGVTNHRDREFFFKTNSDMQNKLMAKTLVEYASTKSKIDQPPDEPVTAEERLEETKALREAGDVFEVGA